MRKLAHLCHPMPILAHFGEVFWGFGPLNVNGYCRNPQKAHSWRIDRADRSRNATWARAEESKKERM